MWFQVAHVLEESNLLQERHEITAFKLNYQLDVEWSMGLGHGNTYSPVGLYSSILYIKKNCENAANMSAAWVKTDSLWE